MADRDAGSPESRTTSYPQLLLDLRKLAIVEPYAYVGHLMKNRVRMALQDFPDRYHYTVEDGLPRHSKGDACIQVTRLRCEVLIAGPIIIVTIVLIGTC